MSVWLPFNLGFLESRDWDLTHFFFFFACFVLWLALGMGPTQWVCIYLIKQSWPCSKNGFKWT